MCAPGPTLNGIDVSEYDDAVDWTTAKGSGISFAFIRVSDGLAFPDSKFDTYWPAARAAGVVRGPYQFFEPDVDPIQQADTLLAKAALEPGDLPPVLDIETADGLSTAEVMASVHAWIEEVTNAIGRPPIVYAGLYSWPSITGGADVTTSPLWIPQYTTAACPDIPDPWTSWLFWQHSDTGVIAGVTSSQLDLDVFSGSAADLQAFALGGTAPCGVLGGSGGIIDDRDPCFAPGGPAADMRQVADAGYDETLTWTHTADATAETNYGEWSLDFAEAGTYRVEAYTAAAYAQSKAADYRIHAAGSNLDSSIDQTAVDGWQPLGDIAFVAGGDQWILLGDNTGEPAQEQLVFDALRFTRLDGSGGGSGSDGGGPPPANAHLGCSSTSGGGASGAVAGVLALVLRRRRHMPGTVLNRQRNAI